AAVASHASVGVDNDLASGQPGVGDRAALSESTTGIDEVFRLLVEELTWDRFADHHVEHAFFDLFVVHIRLVLRGDDDRVDANGFAILVFDRHLALPIGKQPGEGFTFARYRELAS